MLYFKFGFAKHLTVVLATLFVVPNLQGYTVLNSYEQQNTFIMFTIGGLQLFSWEMEWHELNGMEQFLVRCAFLHLLQKNVVRAVDNTSFFFKSLRYYMKSKIQCQLVLDVVV